MKKNFLSLITTLALSISAFSQTFIANHDCLTSTLQQPVDPAIRMVSFTYRDIQANHGITVMTGPGTEYNAAYPWCWLMSWNDTSYITFLVNFTKEEIQKDWYLNVKQLSSIAGHNYSPVAIDLNGINIADHFEPLRDAWRIDHFQLSQDRLKEGQNIITIRLQDAYTHYWIDHVTISPENPASIWHLDFKGQ